MYFIMALSEKNTVTIFFFGTFHDFFLYTQFNKVFYFKVDNMFLVPLYERFVLLSADHL